MDVLAFTDKLSTIPRFPSKRSLELEDKGLFEQLFAKAQPDISELTFTNLFCWRFGYGLEVSRLDDSLILSCSEAGRFCFFAPLGADNSNVAIKRCLQDYPQARFIRVPSAVAQSCLKDTQLRVEEDRDSFDYVYRRRDLIELKGKKYDAKRNFIKRFFNQYKPVCRQASPDDAQQCLEFHNEWCDDKACETDSSLKREKGAIIEMLRHCHELSLFGAVIEVSGKIIAFSLGEKLNDTTFVVHAEKANGRFVGAYQAINNYFASVVPEDFEFINREEDLGIENLRKAKMSYQPCRFIKKFILSKKEVK
jgi:hypothetical protein